eukprot:3855934-Pleurochrysis_carterae.AAC.4
MEEWHHDSVRVRTRTEAPAVLFTAPSALRSAHHAAHAQCLLVPLRPRVRTRLSILEVGPPSMSTASRLRYKDRGGSRRGGGGSLRALGGEDEHESQAKMTKLL